MITKPLTRGGLFLRVGLGGFVDGILFHQIFQIHAMLTARLPKDSIRNIEINMFWDGIFHSFTWFMTVVGLILLFRARSVPCLLWSGRLLTGAMFLGWGLFNLVEGGPLGSGLQRRRMVGNNDPPVPRAPILSIPLSLPSPRRAAADGWR